MGLITKLATVVRLQKFRRRVVKSNLRQEKETFEKWYATHFFHVSRLDFLGHTASGLQFQNNNQIGNGVL